MPLSTVFTNISNAAYDAARLAARLGAGADRAAAAARTPQRPQPFTQFEPVPARGQQEQRVAGQAANPGAAVRPGNPDGRTWNPYQAQPVFSTTQHAATGNAARGVRALINAAQNRIDVEMNRYVVKSANTNLHQAAAAANLPRLCTALSSGAFINFHRSLNGQTALIAAAGATYRPESVSVMRHLVKAVDNYGTRVDWNARDMRGNTALHAAAAAGNLYAVHILLDAAAQDLGRPLDTFALNNAGQNCFAIAQRNGHQAICDALVDFNLRRDIAFGHGPQLGQPVDQSQGRQFRPVDTARPAGNERGHEVFVDDLDESSESDEPFIREAIDQEFLHGGRNELSAEDAHRGRGLQPLNEPAQYRQPSTTSQPQRSPSQASQPDIHSRDDSGSRTAVHQGGGLERRYGASVYVPIARTEEVESPYRNAPVRFYIVKS
ncbi:hypothetical protein BH09PSE5_BH09PSE5_33120 [soil metagenome]